MSLLPKINDVLAIELSKDAPNEKLIDNVDYDELITTICHIKNRHRQTKTNILKALFRRNEMKGKKIKDFAELVSCSNGLVSEVAKVEKYTFGTKHAVKSHLEDHPEDKELTNTELADKLKVNRATVSAAKKELEADEVNEAEDEEDEFESEFESEAPTEDEFEPEVQAKESEGEFEPTEDEFEAVETHQSKQLMSDFKRIINEGLNVDINMYQNGKSLAAISTLVFEEEVDGRFSFYDDDKCQISVISNQIQSITIVIEDGKEKGSIVLELSLPVE